MKIRPNATTQATTASVNEGAETDACRGAALGGAKPLTLWRPESGAAPASVAKGSINPQLPQNLPPGVWAVPH
ncbi:MAG TPA: hypothetical protein VFO33_06460 [Casimicrobiaceae bacterium]|nr:hypothetical protein [Casimicrobiaceae bacterium]